MKIVLINPDIPWNAGNIGRTCVATGSELVFTGRLGFKLTDKEIRRSGLDYWQFLKYSVYATFEDFLKTLPENPSLLFFQRMAASAIGKRHIKKILALFLVQKVLVSQTIYMKSMRICFTAYQCGQIGYVLLIYLLLQVLSCMKPCAF